MKKINLPKFHWAKLLSIFFFILLFGAYSNILAIGQKYNPGDTLDPACSPGEINCTVLLNSGGGTPGGADTEIQFNNNGTFDGNSGFTWVSGSPWHPFSIGPDVTFTKADYETTTTPPVDNISQYVHIARDSARSIYNKVSESHYDDINKTSPVGTEWNTDGWSDLSDVTTRTYVSFMEALNNNVGDNAVGSQLVMHDIQGGKYYKIDFTSWSSGDTGGTGGFAYTRTEINPADGSLVVGTTVDFTRPDSVAPYDDISPSVHLTRNETKGLYNAVNESFYDWDNNLDPTGTEWNSAGWGDLTDVATRAYTTFSESLDGRVGENIIGAELVMHDIVQDQYYKFSFSSWTSADNGTGGGGFSYTRNLITLPGDVPGRLSASANMLLNGENRYLNFGTEIGVLGYGLRDNNGVIQYKDEGGNWGSFGGVINVNNDSNLFSTGLAGTGSGTTSVTNSIFLGVNAGNGLINSAGSNFLGYNAGYQATGASSSNFLGMWSGYQATNAAGSNFLGSSAGDSATNANSSNFLGTYAGFHATGASSSNFFGQEAGRWASSASYSNFFGNNAGYLATNSYNSNFMGYKSGYQASDAINSNFMGTNSGSGSHSSYSNFLGYNAGFQSYDASNSNFFGQEAGRLASSASYSNFFGNNAGYLATNASNSIFIGQKAGYFDYVNNTSNDLSSILIGSFTNTGGYSNSILLGSGTSSSSIYNTKANQFMLAPTLTEMRLRGIDYTLPASQGGASTVLTNDGSGGLTWASAGGGLSSDADFNTKGGTSAGLNLVAGAQYNTFLGYEAGKSAAVGGTNAADNNTGIGYQSLFSNTTGFYNTAIGSQSLYNNTTGFYNTANGFQSLSLNTTGFYNTANGLQSLYNNTTGNSNAANGMDSLYSNTTGSYNTANGMQSGQYTANGSTPNQTSNNSLYLGYDTRALADGDTNEIVIGASAIGNGSNTATIGNTSLFRTYLTGINLKAGTATAGTAPLKFTSGTNLSTTEAGAVEYDGSHLYFTATNGGTRYQLDQQSGAGSQWTTDTNGITYSSGNVGIGTGSSSSAALKLQVNNKFGIEVSSTSAYYPAIRVSSTIMDEGVIDVNTGAHGHGVQVNADGQGTRGIYSYVSSGDSSDSIAVYGGNESNSTTGVYGGYFAGFNSTGAIGVGAEGVNSDVFLLSSGILRMKERASSPGNPDTDSGFLYGKTDGKIYFKNDGGTEYDLTATGGGLSSDADFNTKGGTSAGLNLVSGARENTFLGYESGKGGIVTNAADDNTAIGFQSLYSNTTGYQNTTNGAYSLYSNTTGRSNTANGISSLYSNTTGYANTTNGSGSLYSNTTGYNNTANGTNSLYFNTTGNLNTANGNYSLYSNTTGSNNIASGNSSLYSNKTGSGGVAYGAYSMYYANDTLTPWTNSNTAIGYESLRGSTTPANNTGNSNTALGYQSLFSNTTGGSNATNGYQTLYSNTTGQMNTANGYISLYSNTTGQNNTASGGYSLRLNTTGSQNTASGYDSLSSNTTGNRNTANGEESLSYNTTGVGNIAIGYRSGMYIADSSTPNRTSSYSTYIGYNAHPLVDGGTSEIVIGQNAIGNGSDTATIGNVYRTYLTGVNLTQGSAIAGRAPLKFAAGTNLSTTEAGAIEYDGTHLYFTATNGGTRYQLDQQGGGGGLSSDADFNTKGGTSAGLNLVSGAQYNTFLGYEAGKSAAVGGTNAADNNTAIGYQSLLVNTTGENNTANGYISLTANTTGSYNTANGSYALRSNTTGSYNTAHGYGSLFFNTTGAQNTALGALSLTANTTGSNNVAIGEESLWSNTTGNNNTATGKRALYSNTGGYNNTAIGFQSLYSNTLGYFNTADGFYSLYSNTIGGYNTANGYSSLYSNVANNRSTAIGYNSMYYADDRTSGRDTYNTALGYEALRGSTTAANNTGQFNTAIGDSSLWSNTSGVYNTANGYQALYSNTTGASSTATGYKALYSTNGGQGTAMGYQALTANTTGANNSSFGYSALSANTTGGANTSLGSNSMISNVTGGDNVAVGVLSLYNNNSAYANTAIGTRALFYSGKTVSAGSFIVGIQYTIVSVGSTDFTTIGSANNNVGTVFTASGVGTGSGTASSWNNNNVSLGDSSAMYAGPGGLPPELHAPRNSVFLGSSTRASADGNQNEIVIGYNTIGNGSNTTTLGTGNVLYVGGSSVSGMVARFTNSAGYCDINPLTTSLTCTSDINLKKNITTLNIEDNEFSLNENIITPTTTLEKILALTPVTYNWKTESDGEVKHIGFIAQEMEQIFPDLVFTDVDTGIKSIAFTNLIPYTIEAIKEMDLKVKDLSSLDTTNATSLGSLVKGFLENASNTIDTVFFGKVHTKELCFDGEQGQESICITRDSLEKLLPQTETTTVEKNPDATCFDGIMNQDETNIDEGGVCGVLPKEEVLPEIPPVEISPSPVEVTKENIVNINNQTGDQSTDLNLGANNSLTE